jgi:hypothetical protein
MQKDVFRAGSGGPTGSDQMQGKGVLPNKVNVPLPGTNSTQKPYKKHMSAGSVSGFSGGVIPGKV